MHSPDHGSTIRYQRTPDGTFVPVLHDSMLELEQYKLHTSHFQDGVIDGIKALFNGEIIPVSINELNPETALTAMDALFIATTNDELDLLSNIGHCAHFDHSVHERILVDLQPNSFEELDRVLNASEWKTGQIRYLLRSTYPHDLDQLRAILRDKLWFLGERVIRGF